MPTCTLKVEMTGLVALVDEDGNTLVDQNGDTLVADGWADISADVLTSGAPTWSQGNSGTAITDRVSNIGTFTFTLNNSVSNSGGLNGYYSPDHNNRRDVYFGLDAKVRVSVLEGVNTHEEWMGKIHRIEPVPGQYGARKTNISCQDWMSFAAKDNLVGITVQTEKRDDQILQTLINLASEAPVSTDFSTGDDMYTYALHDENSLKSSLMRVFQKLMMSGLGRLYLTNWGVLTYRSRADLLLSGTPDATLNDDMFEMTVAREKGKRIKAVSVSTYPVQIDTSAAVLWASQRERSIPAGETVSFDVSLRDPSGRATRIAASSLESAVANTDYKFSSTSGSGTDLNGNLTISYTLKADMVSVSLTNTAGVIGYLWLHQIRGYGIYLYEPVTVRSDTGQPDGEVLNVDMIYQDDPNVGDDMLTLLTSWNAVDYTDVESVTFIANRDSDLMAAAFLSPGSLVSISETQTGISRNFIINGTSKTMTAGNILYVTWYLIQANQIETAWFLEVAGFSELESTTYLGA